MSRAVTISEIHGKRAPIAEAELHEHLRKLIAIGYLVAVCNDDGPTKFALTPAGREFLGAR